MSIPWMSFPDILIMSRKTSERLWKERRKRIKTACLTFKDDFVVGMKFGVVAVLVPKVISPVSPFVNSQELFVDSLTLALDRSFYPFVRSVSYEIVQPKIETMWQWVGWTAATGAVAGAAMKAIIQPVRNYADGCGLTENIINGMLPASVSCAASQVAEGLALMKLPHADELGGSLGRNILVGCIRSFGSRLGSCVVSNQPLGRGVFRYLASLPTVIVDEVLYRAIKSQSNPFRLL